MKKFLALSLVLAAATIAKGAVPSSVEVRRGGLVSTNSPVLGYYLSTDGTNFYWSTVTAANTNIPNYVLTNNQSSAVTLASDLSVSQLLTLPGTGGGTGARIAGRADAASLNITNFIRNFGWVTTDGPLTNAVGLYNANDAPSYFLNLAGTIAGAVSANSLQNTNIVTTNAYIGVLRVTGLQTNSTDQRIVGSNPKLYVQALSSPNTTFLDGHGLGTVSGGSQPYIIISVEGNQVLFLTDTNFLPAPGINYSLGQGAAGNIFSGIFASNATFYTSVTNKYLPTNSIMRVGPGGIITTSIIGSGLSLAADGTLSATGGGGGGGGLSMDYVALPTSGIIGGTQLAYSTNLTALSSGITVTASNLLSTNRYFLQWKSAGQKVTFANSAAWFFTDSGQGGYSESSTNAGFHELQIWKDAVSGQTNALYHGPEYKLVFGSGVTASTNNLTGEVTITASGSSSITAGQGIYQFSDGTLVKARLYDPFESSAIPDAEGVNESTSTGGAISTAAATATGWRLGGRGGMKSLKTWNTNTASYASLFFGGNSVSSPYTIISTNTASFITVGFDFGGGPFTNCPVVLGTATRFDATAPGSAIGWVLPTSVTNKWGCFSVNNSTTSGTNYVGPPLTTSSNALVRFGFELSPGPIIVFTTNGIPAWTNSTANTIPTNVAMLYGVKLGTDVAGASSIQMLLGVDTMEVYEK